MRLNLFFVVDVALCPAVLNKFPKTLAFILVNNRHPLLIGNLDSRPALHILQPFVPLRQIPPVDNRSIKVNGTVVVGEVHVAICADMVDEQLVVEEDWIAIMLVTAVGVNFPDNLLGGLRTHFYGECAVSRISRFE